MKCKGLARGIASVTMATLVATSFAGCNLSLSDNQNTSSSTDDSNQESNEVEVTVNIGDKKVVAEGTKDMTVGELLDNAGIVLSSKDSVEPQADVKWADAGASSITIKRFATVTVTDGTTTKKVELVGGTVEEAIANSGFNKDDYEAPSNGDEFVTDGMTITLVLLKEGFEKKDGKGYYYSKGQVQTGGIVGSDENGYYYADENGVIDLGYCDAIKDGDTAWNVINGEATKAETDSQLALNHALAAVAKCTDSSMTKEEKLRACFDYLRTSYLEGVRHDPPYKEMDWPVIYADDIFVYGKGDCFSYGAAFAYMARGIGYTETYACNSGGHGWAEVDNLVYDPEWSLHNQEDNFFGVRYDDETSSVKYWKGIQDGAEWKRIKVE